MNICIKTAFSEVPAKLLIWIDLSEKDLYPPPLFVDIGDRFDGQLEVVGQELKVFSNFRITVADFA